MSESAVLPTIGEPLFGPVPSLDISALGQCWNGTVDILTDLELAKFPAERILIRRNPLLRDDDKTPCATVSHYSARPDNSAGTNNETAVHYLFLLAFHWAEGRTAVNGEAEALAAWETTYIRFSKRPRPFLLVNSVGDLRDCKIDQADALNQQAFMRGWMVKFLIVDYFVRLPYREGL